MLKKKVYRISIPLFALGVTLMAAGMAGCNKVADAEPSKPPAVTPGESRYLDFEDGRLLEGTQLQSFLKLQEGKSSVEVSPEPNAQLAPLAKSAAACFVNFNSPTGLSYMADKAYTFYATSPYYIQSCSPYYAYVAPINTTLYYLVPEAANVCTGAYGMMGYGPSYDNCKNQQSAANFPRIAGTIYNTSGLSLILKSSTGQKNFRLNSFVGKEGTITVYAYRVGIGWWYWGPLPSNNTYWTFSNAEKVNEVQFFATDRASLISVDDINVTPL
ncbi:MAG: hypothetical protein ABIW76_08455 [Fibrobacteria bacterium]